MANSEAVLKIIPLPLKKLYTFVSHFLRRVGPNRQAKEKGRPQKYEDALILPLSYRKIFKKAKNEGFEDLTRVRCSF